MFRRGLPACSIRVMRVMFLRSDGVGQLSSTAMNHQSDCRPLCTHLAAAHLKRLPNMMPATPTPTPMAILTFSSINFCSLPSFVGHSGQTACFCTFAPVVMPTTEKTSRRKCETTGRYCGGPV